MGIIDGLEVSLTIPNHDPVTPPLVMSETALGSQSHEGILSWAAWPKRTENWIKAPEGTRFGICITLHEDFDMLGDGLHITLKFDEGQIVNHYYSVKYGEMDRDAAGKLTKTIPSAFVQYGNVYQTVMFEFGRHTPASSGAPIGYYPAGQMPPQGKLVATIIRVNHQAGLGPVPMAVPQGTILPPGSSTSTNTMNPVPLATHQNVPMVNEQTVPVENSDTYAFIFRYRPTRVPVSDCVCGSQGTAPSSGGGPGGNNSGYMNLNTGPIYNT